MHLSLLFLSSALGQTTVGLDGIQVFAWDHACASTADRPAFCDDGYLLEDGDDGELIWTRGADFAEMVADKRAFYQARDEAAFGPEMDLAEALQDLIQADLEAGQDPADDPSAVITPLACGGSADLTPDGQGGCKLIFGSDSRNLMATPRNYPRNKHLMYRRQSGPYWDQDPTYPVWPTGQCSITMIDEDYALTAAHCVYDTSTNTWLYQGGILPSVRPSSQSSPAGTDAGRGYVCRGGAIYSESEFADQCEYVQSRWVLGGFVDASSETTMEAYKHDVAILKLRRANHASGIGSGAWLALSSIDSASTLEQKTAISHGYPGARPTTSANSLLYMGPWPDFFTVAMMDQYKSHGAVISETTSKRLATKVECAPGQSGSGIFYYTDDGINYNGQGHYIIGVLSGSVDNDNGNSNGDYCGGPTVKQFRDWAYSVLP